MSHCDLALPVPQRAVAIWRTRCTTNPDLLDSLTVATGQALTALERLLIRPAPQPGEQAGTASPLND